MEQPGAVREINFARWAADIFVAPRAFFSQIPRQQGYGKPVLYALFWFFVAAVIEGVFGLVRGPRDAMALIGYAGWLVLGPPILLVCLFIGTALVFVIWHLMGSRENYRASFWCLALMSPLAAASSLLGPIPYVHLLTFVWGIYLLVIASETVHALSRKSAWTVWGVLGGLFILMSVLFSVGSRRLPSELTGAMPYPGAADPSRTTGSIDPDQIRKNLESELREAYRNQEGR